MQFINPWLLLGLAGISVPIIIHLMNRFRYRDVDWAAMDLLRKVLVVRSRRMRLEDLLLLLLRCAIIGLLALSITRPTLTGDGAVGWLAKRADVGTVIAVDASFSMAHKPGVYARFDRALQRVRGILETLKPGDPVTVVLMGERPQVLFRNTGYEPDRFVTELEKAVPLPEGLNIEMCLAEIESLVGEIKAPVRECYLVTDAQTVSWSKFSDPSRAALERIAALGRVYYLPVASTQTENLAITRFEQESGMVREGTLARYVAAVSNSGQKTRERVAVTLYAGDKAQDQRIIPRIAPGKTEEVPLFVRFDQPGALRLTTRIGDDSLPVDNAQFAVANVRSQDRILCVEGTPSSSAATSEVHYLLAALAPRLADDAKDPLKIDRVDWLDLTSDEIGDYDIVILVDVPELQEDQVKALGQFVSAGGGLITFLGPNIDPAAINQRMQFDGQPLLPGTILDAVGEPGDLKSGKSIEPIASRPLARAVAGLPKGLLDESRVCRFFPVQLATGGQPVVKLGSGPTDILVAEKRLGRGNVVLLTSTADSKWTDLVTHPAYPILLQEAITQLGREAYERPLIVGEPLVLPLPLRSAETEKVTFISPDGVERIVKTVRRDGQVLVELGPMTQAEFCEVRYAADAALPVAVNVDPVESDVRCLMEAMIDESLQGTKVTVVRETDDLAAAIRGGRIGREIWWELLLAGMVLLLVEGYLAYRFTQHVSGDIQSRPGGSVSLTAPVNA